MIAGDPISLGTACLFPPQKFKDVFVPLQAIAAGTISFFLLKVWP